MFHVALLEPEIPPNTGNIARMCAATGCELHLIEPLGFRIDNRHLLRAGIDYWHLVTVRLHQTFEEFEATRAGQRLFVVSAHARRPYTTPRYRPGDVFLFGKESTGLPKELLQRHEEHAIKIPMPAGLVRCLNLSTAAGIVVYEALRQVGAWVDEPIADESKQV